MLDWAKLIGLVLAAMIAITAGFAVDWYFTTEKAKELNSCVEYNLFFKTGFQVAKCEPGQQIGDWW